MSSSSTSSSDSDSDEEEANRRAMPRRRTYVSGEDDEDEAVRIPRRRRSISSDNTESESSSRSSRRRRRRASSSPIHRANRSLTPRPHSPSSPAGKHDDVVSTADDDERPRSPSSVPPWQLPPPEYTVPVMLFSCAVPRSLRIGTCRLSPPAAISLPSLEELLLTRVSDEEGDVQRLVLRCCHNLASVAIDDTIHSLEYRGAVPNTSLIALPGGSHASFTSCKVDICGKEVSSAEELTKLGEFMQQLASTKHLHLQSARLGSGFDHDALVTLPAFTRLLHLELMGQLPRDKDGAADIAALGRILQHAPQPGGALAGLHHRPSRQV
ncbi:hypothetical protein ACQ4PT_056819 [Festuca glaucescens]